MADHLARRDGLQALLAGLAATAVYCLAAVPYHAPPSMDAYYYVDIGRGLAAGRGFTEHFVWSYLPPPASLDHPSSTYWLPLFSVLVAGSLVLFGGGYWAERLPGLACAGAYVGLTYFLARRLSLGPRGALGAAGLVLFNGLWFHDFTTPDAFVPYAPLATCSLAALAAGLCRPAERRWWALGGLCAALASLTRQEGVLLVAVAVLLLVWRARRDDGRPWSAGAAYLGAFALARAPWELHLLAAGASLSGGTATLWMRSYGDFYSYGRDISPSYYFGWGWTNILSSKMTALLFLVSFWIFLWQIFLVPFLVTGLLVERKQRAFTPFLLYMALLALALPLLFTFPSLQGTLPHASMSLLSFAACATMAGLEWLTRSWANALRWAMMVGLVGGAAGVSVWWAHHSFDSTAPERRGVVAAVGWLDRHAPAGVPAVVDDPPAFAYYSDRPTIIMPSNGLAAVVGAARRYGAGYWVTSGGEGPPSPAAGRKVGVHLLAQVSDSVRIYAVTAPPPGQRHRRVEGKR